jgi:lipopolysaccharide transport system ATP-binding protein
MQVLPAIKVEGVWKEYVVGASRKRADTFYESLSNTLAAPFKRLRGESEVEDDSRFWALKDVSFEVQPGEVVGVIGRNGAGKSTLLKILSRITAPTKGRIEVRGRLASLLEVGTGFHPELSGRENIFLNGAILGMTRRDIQNKFDEIVAFAEVEKFIDTPVKRYSSGMYVRLAFAVAAHLDADVLIIDEVLAVGDITFQEKCLDKMNTFASAGRTVLFVSHDHAAVARLCSRSLLLQDGVVQQSGSVSDVLETYERLTRATTGHAGQVTGPLRERVHVTGVRVGIDAVGTDEALSPLERQFITVRYDVMSKLQAFRLRVGVYKLGALLFSSYDAQSARDVNRGCYESTFVIPAKTLSPGRYSIDVVAFVAEYGKWLRVSSAGSFSISPAWSEGYESDESMGMVVLGSVVGEFHEVE